MKVNEVNEVSGQVVDAAIKVHTALGPGLLESAYEACLMHELEKRGLKTERQVGLPVEYDGVRIDLGYRLDLLVENEIIVYRVHSKGKSNYCKDNTSDKNSSYKYIKGRQLI